MSFSVLLAWWLRIVRAQLQTVADDFGDLGPNHGHKFPLPTKLRCDVSTRSIQLD